MATKIGNIIGPAGAAGATGPPGTAGGTGPRTTATATTSSLATGAVDSTTKITMQSTYRLLTIQTSKPARVRLYTTPAARTADASRALGTDPDAAAGVALEYVTADVITYSLSPTVSAANLESTPSDDIPMSVTNNGSTGTVTVTVTYEQVE